MNPETNEGICQTCGAVLLVKEDNLGFIAPDPTYIEIWTECPNGCEQPESEVL